MHSCHTDPNQFLDYLYDLLDPAETSAVEEHLKNCPHCQAKLQQAVEQKKLLGLAAKSAFPDVRFDAPTLPLPQSTGQPSPHRRRRNWQRQTVAAAILIAVLGVGVPGGAFVFRSWQIDQLQARAAECRKALEERASQMRSHFENVLAEIQDAAQAVNRLEEDRRSELIRASTRPLHVSITGPETVSAGAANEYIVRLSDQAYRPAQGEITAELIGRDQKPLARRPEIRHEGNGYYHVSLPRDLPLGPDEQLSLVVHASLDRAPGAATQAPLTVTEKLTLSNPLYMTHLTTDKPMYLPGEVVHFRSLTLERFRLTPPREAMRLLFTLTKPTGEQEVILSGSSQVTVDTVRPENVLLGPDDKPIQGIGAGDYTIRPDAPGGEYTLTVKEANNRFPPQERKFLVNRYEKPRLNKELDFTRKSYGPGAEVTAACKVARAEGGKPVAGQLVTATVTIDGKTYGADGKLGGFFGFKTDEAGGVLVRFKLPTAIERGDATLSVVFQDGGSVETLVRPIPLVLKKLRVNFYPEGGDLVAGVPNRVYFQALTTLDKPAELKGRIADAQGAVVASVETFHDATQPGANQGMGRFEFVPKAGQKYELKIDAPAGVEGRYFLPDVKPAGVVLRIADGVAKDTDPIRVAITSVGQDRALLVGAYCRGRLMVHQRLRAVKDHETKVDLQPEAGVGGVYRVTVYEEATGDDGLRLVPRAERLIYRVPAGRLHLELQANKPHYVPGDRVKVHCRATDEKGDPAPAVLMMAAVDKSVLKLADEKTYRSMPTHFLLTSEVRRPEDLEYADFLLSDHANAGTALDLLLGTQGWRRFAEQNPRLFRKEHPGDADRLLVTLGQISPATLAPKTVDLDALAIQQEVDERLQARAAQAQKRLATARAKLADLQARTTAERQQMAQLRAAASKAEHDAKEGAATLESYRPAMRWLCSIAVIMLTGLVVVVVLQVLIQHRHFFTVPRLALGGVLAVIGLFAFTVTRVDRRPMRMEVAQLNARAIQEEALPAAPPQPPRRHARMMAPADGGGGGEVPAVDFDASRPGAPTPARGRAVRRPPEVRARDNLGDREQELERLKEQLEQAAGANRFRADAKRPDGTSNTIMLDEFVGARGAAKILAESRARKEAAQLEQQGHNLPLQPQMNGFVHFGPAKGSRGGRGAFKVFGAPNFAMERAWNDGTRWDEVNLEQFADQLSRAEQVIQPQAPATPCLIREYAYQRNRQADNVRADFTETIYWQPVLVAHNGEVDASFFDLPDSVTTFEVLAAGHTLDGRLGSATLDLQSRLPLTLEPKLPIEVTANDRIDVPVAIANNTDAAQAVHLTVSGKDLELDARPGAEQVDLPSNARIRRLYRLQPTIEEGNAELRLDSESLAYAGDHVSRSIRVVPDGFPIAGSHSDLLEGVAEHDVVLPESWIRRTLKFQVAVYPSPLADLQKGLESLLQEPGGCFEQTSSSNYPNVLILSYLKETDQARPEIARRARELLEHGYQKLISFECLDEPTNQRRGYEWFGGTVPPHEALTAYGLLEFRDMARVFDVDAKMIQRTRDYLMASRDGHGGFRRNPRAADHFGRAPEAITNAYIVWALSESGPEDDLTTELNALAEQAKSSKDPYFLALVADSLLNRDRTPEALVILKRLVAAQQADGHLNAEQTSITASGGRDLQIETTALVLLGWLKAERADLFHTSIEAAVKWLGQQRGGYGGFGSTQSTILALKALLQFAHMSKRTTEASDLIVSVGGQEVKRQHIEANVEQAITLDVADAEKFFRPGTNRVRVEMTGQNKLPYTMAWSYRSPKPASAEDCPVRLKTRLDAAKKQEGETASLAIHLENTSAKGQGMAVAIIGLPAGLTLPEDMKQLKDLARLRDGGTTPGPISAWETRGRELVLYWRDLAPHQKIDLHVDLICRVPGIYRGPASRAYLYYNADHKFWTEPLRIDIEAKETP